jgi:Na+/proline symporter
MVKPAPVVEAMSLLGYRDSLSLGIGLLALACLALYLIPRTAVLGAVLLTGYLGGAVAAHVRAGSEPFPVVFPLLLGLLFWARLAARDARARAIFLPRG